MAAASRGIAGEGGRVSSPDVRRLGIYAAVALVIFLAGLVPMWLKASAARSQRDAARRELQLSRMQNMLASSAVDAGRGEYEPARQEASDFFTALREHLEGGGADVTTLSAAQREGLKPLLTERDDLITLLARGDPAAGPRLLAMHAAFRRAISGAPQETKAPR
jgi:hypothetical protein